MTLLVALKGKDGIVAAADSRGTFGDPRGVTAQNDNMLKVHLVSPHVAVLIAGAGELGTQLLTEITATAKAQNTDGATPIMELARATAKRRYAEWFPHLQPALPPGIVGIARPDIGFVIAGYDQETQRQYTLPRLYSVPSSFDFPPMMHEYGFAISGVAQYALYLLNRLYEPNRSLKDLTSLAVYVITETASQDGKVGGPVRVVTVKPEGGTTLSEDEVRGIHESNEKRGATLRKSFYIS